MSGLYRETAEYIIYFIYFIYFIYYNIYITIVFIHRCKIKMPYSKSILQFSRQLSLVLLYKNDKPLISKGGTYFA